MAYFRIFGAPAFHAALPQYVRKSGFADELSTVLPARVGQRWPSELCATKFMVAEHCSAGASWSEMAVRTVSDQVNGG